MCLTLGKGTYQFHFALSINPFDNDAQVEELLGNQLDRRGASQGSVKNGEKRLNVKYVAC